MPLIVNEVAPGSTVDRNSSENRVAETRTRSFRVILSEPGESVSYEAACGVSIGQSHPDNGDLICTRVGARFEGDSRTSVVVTFSYEPNPNGGNDQPPPARPANWSISSATSEVPVSSWRPRTKEFDWGIAVPAANPVGDPYDGVTKLEPIVKISISQWESTDPTRHADLVGKINNNEASLGTLQIRPHQLLFVGFQATPAVETWGEATYRGWRTEYEFAFKRNVTSITISAGGFFAGIAPKFVAEVAIGWDIAVPQTGFNVNVFDPKAPDAVDDVFGQPLRHGERGTKFYGQIIPPPDGYILPEELDPNDPAKRKARAMVKVFSYQNKGASQAPSAQPIPLNDNGRPRLITDANKPIVYAYQVYDDMDFVDALGLRLT
jgi:hypothetical protein